MAVWQPSQIAATMRMISSSSSFLMALASTMGDAPSVQLTPASRKAFIMLRSTKSTPSWASWTPYFFISSTIALVNFVTCWREPGPTAPLIHEYA